MKRKILVNAMAIFMIALMTSCGKVPQAEIDSAQMAIENARSAGSELYASEQFSMVVDSFNVVREQIEKRNSKFFKSFSNEKEMLEGIVILADETRMAAETKKQEVILEFQTSLEMVNALVIENKELLTKAPKGKEGKLALQAISNDISAVEESIVYANSLYTSEQYLLAVEAIRTTNEKATAINTELKEVLAKYNKAK